MKRNRLALLVAAVTAAFAAVAPVQAQQYPNKPIRIVVPYAAGGTSDILARQIGPKLTEAWGQPVIVENRPGANGNVGAEFVAKSAPDGYTLLLTDLGGLVISASVYPKLPFNPSKDFSPVVMVSYSPHVLAVHPDVQVKNVAELVAMAKAHPGKLNFAVSGIGGAPQLAGIEFAQLDPLLWLGLELGARAHFATGRLGAVVDPRLRIGLTAREEAGFREAVTLPLDQDKAGARVPSPPGDKKELKRAG